MNKKARKAKEMRTAKQKLAIVKKIESAPRGKKNLVMRKLGVYPAQVAGWKKLQPWKAGSAKKMVKFDTKSGSMKIKRDAAVRIAKRIGKTIGRAVKESSRLVEMQVTTRVLEALMPKKSRG